MSPIKKLLMNPIQHLPHQRKLAQAARQKKYDALIVLNMGQEGRQILFSITECFTLREMERKRVVCHLNASMERPSLMSDVVARSIAAFFLQHNSQSQRLRSVFRSVIA